MATLRALQGGRRIQLPPRTTVGRLHDCEINLDNPRVSGRHAALQWRSSGHWEVKDLGSRNGTSVDGERLRPGAWHTLRVGAVMAFGETDESWELADDSPPVLPMAVPLASGEVQLPVQGVLLLPDEDAPEACVQRVDSGWIVERADGEETVVNGAVVVAAGRLFRVFLPRLTTETVDASAQRAAPLTLSFAVSRDEETVRLVAERDGRTADLGVRAHHYTLLTLGRRRLEDRAAGVPAGEEGWVYRDVLLKMLAVDRIQLNMHFYRARKQIIAADLGDEAELLERRPGSGQLRLGIADIEVIRG